MTGKTADSGPERLAEAVRARREQQDLTQEELAPRGGPSARAVRDIEQAKNPSPTRNVLMKLDISLGWPDKTAQRVFEGVAEPGETDAIALRATGAIRADAVVTARASHPLSDDWELRRDPARDREPIVVTVAELLGRLAREQEQTATMSEAVDALSRLLPELYGRRQVEAMMQEAVRRHEKSADDDSADA